MPILAADFLAEIRTADGGLNCLDTNKPPNPLDHSTVTDFAKFRGWSTSVPLAQATW